VVTLQLRALGAKLPDEDLRNPDDLAASFLGKQERAILAAMPMGRVYADMEFATAWDAMPEIQRRVFLHVLARTRMIDDALREAVETGAQQVVILGAGYDSRAYRLRDLLRGTTVFELDLPASQEHKRQRVHEVIGALPPNLRFVPIDFTRQSLDAVLRHAGYRKDLQTFFIWEGVTMYIPETAVSETLRFVAASSAPRSTIAFDFEHQKAIRGEHDDPVLKASNERLARIGEPHIFGFPEGSARATLSDAGLEVVDQPSPQQITDRYLTRRDGTRLGDERWSNGICVARVPGPRDGVRKP
jgi:methyltransferase (TIGR00027 family)